jgi:hypothetical protein
MSTNAPINDTPQINVILAQPQVVITMVPGIVIDGGGSGSSGQIPASEVLPLMDGIAAVGIGTPYAREDHIHPSDTSRATVAYVDTSIADLNDVYMRWVRFTGPGQSFLAQNLTRDGDWTMVAIRNTTDRPAPQQSGTEDDLLPAWTPVTNGAKATYIVYNEWTVSQGGWIDQYGGDVLTQNLNATHTMTLMVDGVVKDTFTSAPVNAGLFWQNITPIIIAAGSVIRVTVKVTQVQNNTMYWYEQAGLFATLPPYCSLAQGSKDGGAAGTTAYGCHLMFIPGTFSPDWDIVAFGG